MNWKFSNSNGTEISLDLSVSHQSSKSLKKETPKYNLQFYYGTLLKFTDIFYLSILVTFTVLVHF